MTSITRRTAQALAAAAILLPIIVGSSLSQAQSAATPPAAPVPATATVTATDKTALADLRDMSRIIVGGQVAEVFGNRFILEDASGRALVDLGPSGDERPLVVPGETLTVEGRFDRGSVKAAALVHADGRREAMREPRGAGRDGPGRDGPGHDGPGRRGPGEDGPRGEGRHGHDRHHGGRGDGGRHGEGRRGFMNWFSGGLDEAAATKVLTDAGYKDVALIDKGPRRAEFRAKDAAGQDWRIAVGDDNEIREREPFRAQLTEDQARAAAEKLGYVYDGDYEARNEHVDIAAKTKDGTAVTIELNADGSLRKERFDN